MDRDTDTHHFAAPLYAFPLFLAMKQRREHSRIFNPQHEAHGMELLKWAGVCVVAAVGLLLAVML